MSDMHAGTSDAGIPVVLVHGSLTTGAEEWEAQLPLADHGFRLSMPDRRGYGPDPSGDGSSGPSLSGEGASGEGEDFLRDGEDIAELLGTGAHLVGHSYGGLGAMFAAALRPEAVLSLALLEPPVLALAEGDAAAQAMTDRIRSIWDDERPDGDWVLAFLEAVGTDLQDLPRDFLDEVAPLVPALRRGRPVWQAEMPFAELAAIAAPKLVVSGGHSAGFDAICDALAERIGADRAVVAGAGHEIQLTGEPINEVLLALWASATQ